GIYGGSGNDFLDGGFGFDIIDGGSGVDSTSYVFYSGTVLANLTTGVVSFPNNSNFVDTLISIENLILGSGNDIIMGSSFKSNQWRQRKRCACWGGWG
ncbi:MAG: hypothetical protein JWS10_2752, partial [Cypionkella sp.]|nr:hypothetical protein [Cypionkella sp.]